MKNFVKDQLVIANDFFDGEYIGQYVSPNKLTDTAFVRILACTRYPLQRTVFYENVIYERRPFDFGSVHAFETKEIKPFDGSIVPDYTESVRSALARAIDEARTSGNSHILVTLRSHELWIA